MRFTLFSIMNLVLSGFAKATFSSPKSDDKWAKGQSHTITWDKSDIGFKCDIYLAPAGAIDITTAISQIASSASNSGSYSWTPDNSIASSEVEIIIAASTTTVISDSFSLVDSNTYGSSSSYGSGSHGSGRHHGGGLRNSTHESHGKEKTKTSEIHDTTTSENYEAKTMRSSDSTITSFFTVSENGTYYMQSTILTTIQVTSTVTGALTTYVVTTPIAPSGALATGPPAFSISASTISNLSASYALNATPTALPFTGKGSSKNNAVFATIGCLSGLATMLLLY